MGITELRAKQREKYLERKASTQERARERQPSKLIWALETAAKATGTDLAGPAEPTFADLPVEFRRAACKNSVLAWWMNCQPNMVRPYPHTRVIDRYLVRCFDHTNADNYLMISMPPRCGKTAMATIFGGTRYLAMNPTHHVYCVSHNSDTAGIFGGQARRIFEEFASEIFEVELDPKSRADNRWSVKDHGGSFNCIGWQGPITGRKVHLLIIDDLIKSDEEALSPRIRDKIWSWWDGTASQRVQNNIEIQTKVCSIQTRWTTQDLNGRLIDQERGGGTMRWTKLVLPCLAETGDILIDGEVLMKHGETICPDIIPLQFALDQKRNRSRFWWQATYQQQPITQDGILWGPQLFPDENFVDGWPKDLTHLVVAVDPATGLALKDGDYAAIVALGVDKKGQIFCEADLERAGPVETNERLIDFCRQLPRMPDVIAVEAQGFQFLMTTLASIQLATTSLEDRMVAYTVEDRDVPVNKTNRITELDPLIVNRDIKFIRSPSTSLLVSQLQNFPSRDHDDGPDALELATWVLANL